MNVAFCSKTERPHTHISTSQKSSRKRVLYVNIYHVILYKETHAHTHLSSPHQISTSHHITSLHVIVE